jgi:antitoxin ParD1/3/4
MNVSLTTYYEDIIEQAISSGIYANTSEVIRASLRLLEKELARETKLRDLRAEIDDGINSGESIPWKAEDVKRRGRELIKAEQLA